MKRLILILFLTIVLLPTFILSQTVEQRQFQLAQSYEKSGKLDDASRLYFALLQKNPDNIEFLTSWYRVTKQLNRYSDLLEYLEIRIKNKNDFQTNLLIAEAYWLKGNPNEANASWKKAQELAKSEEDYSKIAMGMVSVRQFQKAIDLYLDARKHFNKEKLFSNDLIKLYSATGRFPEATDEILKDLKASNNFQVAQGRIYALLINDDAKKYLIERLEKEYNSSPSTAFLNVYIWFNRTLGEYQKALEITIKMDKQQKANFIEVLKFANQSKNDGELDIALLAFSYIIENADKNNNLIPTALYGYANTMKQKLIKGKTSDKQQLAKIKEVYQKIVKDFPNSSQKFDALYGLAQISIELDNDPKKALEYLNQINGKYGFTDLYFSAKFDLSRMYLFLEDFDKSKAINLDLINKITKNSNENFKDQINTAYFNISKIHYFLGQIDSVKSYLEKIQITATSPITNDYLSFYSFITNNENLNAGIKSFAKGEFYELIKKYDKSIEYYEQAQNYGRGSELEELAIINIANINSIINKKEKAIQIFEQYIDKFPNSVYMDEVYMKIGKIYLTDGKSELAESTFTKIIVNFPKSIYYEEARQQIRKIRNSRVP